MWSARGSICGCQPRAEEGGSVLDSHVSLCLCDCEDRNGASCRRQLLAAFGWGQRVLSVRNVQGGGEALSCFRARYLQRRGGRGRRVLADGGVNPPKPGPMCGNPARSDACGGRGRDPLQEHIGTAKGGRTHPNITVQLARCSLFWCFVTPFSSQGVVATGMPACVADACAFGGGRWASATAAQLQARSCVRPSNEAAQHGTVILESQQTGIMLVVQHTRETLVQEASLR